MSILHLAIAALAGFVAGGVNSLAGGGTLLSFPILIALGLPPVSANVTNTVALSPGYLGGVISQRHALADQKQRVRRLAVGAALGGLGGSILLLLTSDSAFRNLIPVLLLVATLLLAGQDRIRKALRIVDPNKAAVPTETGTDEPVAAGPVATRDAAAAAVDPSGSGPAAATTELGTELPSPKWLVIPIAVVALYGGYFGAGLGIMLLAALGIFLHDPLPKLNALKQVLAFVINATAALFFLTSHKVYWVVALVMAVSSLIGGNVGGRLAGSVKPARLRVIVVAIGLAVAVAYGIKIWA